MVKVKITNKDTGVTFIEVTKGNKKKLSFAIWSWAKPKTVTELIMEMSSSDHKDKILQAFKNFLT